MDGKKKKGTRVTIGDRSEAARQPQSDMSKYAKAVSNKSKRNYAELKLTLREAPETGKTAVKPEEKKKSPAMKAGKKAEKKTVGGKKSADGIKSAGKTAAKKTDKSSVSTAEERYSNALGSGDHYSSAIEKYYLKYPDKKRTGKKTASERKQPPKKKRRGRTSSGDSAEKQTKLSMAEIAVRNKQSSSVKRHARAARNARARGVISTKVANRSVYRRKKRRSGALNVLMVTLLLVFLISVGVLVFFDIKQVQVEGDSPYSAAQIKNICAFTKGSNILFIDSDSAEKRVVRELPYIEECTVDRRLPSTVVIRVKKADVLGVAQGSGSQWAVLSTEGKILETSGDKPAAVGKPSAVNEAGSGAENGGSSADTVLAAGSAGEIAGLRMIPLLTGIDLKNEDSEGFLTGDSLEQVKNLVLIRDAFNRKEMRLTSTGVGDSGYEAVYDDRILIVFGKAIDAKTVNHRMDEIYHILFARKSISDNDKGTFRFVNNRVYFRYKYDVSEGELDQIIEERHRRNQQKLYSMAEIFMSAGKDWLYGELKTE